MQTLTEQLSGYAIEGKVSLKKALQIATPIDEERKATVELLKKLVNQVGLHPGEQIQEHLAKMEGRKFNAVEYHYEKEPDSQSI